MRRPASLEQGGDRDQCAHSLGFYAAASTEHVQPMGKGLAATHYGDSFR